MNYNKKGIILGLILLAAAWIGNIFYYNNHVLKEPIFLKHYYDLREGMSNFQLHYIQNINSQQQVIMLTFPELNNENVYFIENDWNSDHRYYKIKTLNITLYRGTPENMPEYLKNKVITKAEVHFSDGKTMTVDFGRIYLYNGSMEKPSILTDTVSSSSNNTGSATFRVGKEVKVTGISTKFPELLDNPLKLNINGSSIKDIKFPMDFKDTSTFDINYSFNFDKKDIRNNCVYNFPINILTEDSSGKKGFGSIYISHWLQSPENYDVRSMVKAVE